MIDNSLIIKQRTHTALTVISPLVFGEHKDQDRARWYGPCQTACVCDGVTSSFYSEKAAELVTTFIPSVFNGNGNAHDRLSIICDLLMTNRRQCLDNKNVQLPDNTPVAMHDMLYKIIQQKRESSFQTTLIAARFISDGNNIILHVIKCGDSAFFAFSPDGQLLSSSLEFASRGKNNGESSGAGSGLSYKPNKIHFGPGDEILIRVEGELSENRVLIEKSSVRPEHAKNWLVCTAIESCCDGQTTFNKNLLDYKALQLKQGEQLLVPKYLYGIRLNSIGRQYSVLKYSSTIRPLVPVSPASFGDSGSATRVLPDHFYTGCFDSFQDSFPANTNFILCSDGFYQAFSGWEQLFEWLKKNEEFLNNEQSKTEVMKKLHSQLNNKSGDDDISFIWVKPIKR